MSLEVENDEKVKIEKVITSADSPVGIDAKKTHIIIINFGQDVVSLINF